MAPPARPVHPEHSTRPAHSEHPARPAHSTRPEHPARRLPPESAEQLVDTPAGEARITWYEAARARSVVALGHGVGGGIQARDLMALADALPAHGVTVALVEQPWRVAGRKLAPAPKTLDAGWSGLWPALTRPGQPVVAGGRSAGARVACRTAGELGAAAVLALAFPLHPPGRPDKSRADELLAAGSAVPVLAVQGGNDSFGHPEEFPAGHRPVEIPYADHGFAIPKRAEFTQEAALTLLTETVTSWLVELGHARA